MTKEETLAQWRQLEQQAWHNYTMGNAPINILPEIQLIQSNNPAWKIGGVFPTGGEGTRPNRVYMAVLNRDNGLKIAAWPGSKAYRGHNHIEGKVPIITIAENEFNSRFDLYPNNEGDSEAHFDITCVLEDARTDSVRITCHPASCYYVVFIQTPVAPPIPLPIDPPVDPPPDPPEPPPGEFMSWHTQYYERAIEIFQQGLPPDMPIPYIHDTSPPHQYLYVPAGDVTLAHLHPDHVFVTPQVGEPYFKLLVYHKLTAAENIGMHNIFCDIIDIDGNRLVGHKFRSWWGASYSTVPYPDAPHLQIVVDKPPSEPGANLPMGEAYYSLTGEGTDTGGFLPSDLVYNLTVAIGDDPGPPHPMPGQGNTRGHHSYYCVFGMAIWTGTEPPIDPPPVEPPTGEAVGTVTIARDDMEQYFRENPDDRWYVANLYRNAEPDRAEAPPTDFS